MMTVLRVFFPNKTVTDALRQQQVDLIDVLDEPRHLYMYVRTSET